MKKVCVKYNIEKDTSEFYSIHNKCKKCELEYAKEYRSHNKERIAKADAEYKEINREIQNKKSLERYHANKDKNLIKNRESYRRFYNKNKNYCCSKVRAYKCNRKEARPSWANLKAISDIYLRAKILTEETNIMYHVDHIILLQGKLVCGLHVPENLQIITAEENLSKSNKFEIL